MRECTNEATAVQFEGRDLLTDVLRKGAHKLLAEAVEAEVTDYLEIRRHCRDDSGKQQVVRNGHLPGRTIVTGIGPVPVEMPRVRDRRDPAEREHFSSKILPPYLRKTRSVEELVPWLYLKGVSTGDFSEALAALLGPNVPGLSATTVTRLKKVWEEEYETWSHRDLSGKQYVYLWADGVHFNVRLEEQDRQCILVVMGATADGQKELIAIQDGVRESEQSWKELLLDGQARGLTVTPKLAIGDGALGFWKAIRQVFTETNEQRCTVHKTANVLDKLPKKIQPKAKDMLHQIWQAETRAAANQAFDLFLATFEAKYPKATECLQKDRRELLAFFDFPAQHWGHLRTTNPIESTFASVRLRTSKTKGCGSRLACLTMVFKLMESAAKTWRGLNGSALIPDVIAGVLFTDGVKSEAA
jgi:putative transposase